MRCGSPRSFPALAEQLAAVQQKLNKLARGYLDELIDEESYQAAKADLVIAKAELKRSKEQLHRNRSGFWNEPAKEIINTLELAGKLQTAKSPQEISQVVHKVGTNRLLSRKTVTFFFPEPFDFIPSLLASRPVAMPNHLTVARRRNWWKYCMVHPAGLNLQPSDPKSEALSN